MMFRRKKLSPDPALEVEFRRQMGRQGKPRELRWIELADQALSKPEGKTLEADLDEQRPKAA